MKQRFPPKENKPGEVALEVKNLSGKYEPTFHDVSFAVKKGEVFGISGLVGSRRTELLNTIFGFYAKESGEIILHGKTADNSRPDLAKQNGFSLLTEERRASGLFPQMNITFNSVIANVRSYGKFLLDSRKMNKDTDWVIKAINVKTPTKRTLIRSLSGGNQQKVIIGRWLLTVPEVLLLDEPTRGIDVGAKYEIYNLILKLAQEGKSVIMVSSEMPELIGICDRILVMSNGRLSGIVERGRDYDNVPGEQETILTLAAKYV
jgi:methyl-galactoside transport system ATP-binding protein